MEKIAKDSIAANTQALDCISGAASVLATIKPEELQPATAIEGFRFAIALLNLIGETGDSPEYMNDAKLDPDTIGQLLMEHLPIPEMGFNVDQKVYWMKVATYLGPDWINEMRRVVAFMQKVDSF